MVSICYEVFPITLVSTQPMLLCRVQEQQRGPWLLYTQSAHHPNHIVLAHLQNVFGNACDLRRAIVHSTSWRYEQEQLLLTYLAVLPQSLWLSFWQRKGQPTLEPEPIGPHEKSYGDHLFPPERIDYQSVLAHALDHLASLVTYDHAIQAVLEPEWKSILASRAPKSAGYLQETVLI